MVSWGRCGVIFWIPFLHWNLLGLIITPELRASATVLGLLKLSRCRCYFPVYWVVTFPRGNWHVHFAFCIAHGMCIGWTADDSTLHCRHLILGDLCTSRLRGMFSSDDPTMHVIATCVCIVKSCNKALLWRLIEFTVFSLWQKRD